MKTKELEFTSTYDMLPEEIEAWEKEHNGVSVNSGNGGVVEIQKTDLYSIDKNGIRILGSKTPALFLCATDECCEDEVYLTLVDKNQIRKLRNYLNDILEKF